MGLTTAMYTSLSGLNANSEAISVNGNNIANMNTTAYKASRISFETQISRLISSGSAPTAQLGGTNPLQIGLGTRVAAIMRNFQAGSLQTTGLNTDLAIEGDGFFVLDFAGSPRYSRAGNFSLDRNFRLVNPEGGSVQGYGVDDDFNVVEGLIGDIVIPVGSQTQAQATRKINFGGVLNAGGDAATVGSLIVSDPIFSDASASVPAIVTDGLDSLFDATGDQLFDIGDIVTVKDIQKGGATVGTRTFEVGPTNTTGSDGAGSSLQELGDFLQAILGIDTGVNGGVSMTASGELSIEGNSGTVNDLTITGSNIVVNESSNPTHPFDFTKQAEADGESVQTSVVAFDSLGNEMVINLGIVLAGKSAAGTQWQLYVHSNDDTDLDPLLGNGTADFDPNGQLVALANPTFTIDRTDTGSFTPQQITIVFDEPNGAVTALAESDSQVVALGQDGVTTVTLDDFDIDGDGTIVGFFSNGLKQDLGRIPLAQFINPHGLVDVSGNLFRETNSSGIAAVVNAGTGGTGGIVSGTLELANVDLSQEFIGLITASTGFSANSRVLTTSDRLLQELLATIR